jgi:hypothetical protein
MLGSTIGFVSLGCKSVMLWIVAVPVAGKGSLATLSAVYDLRLEVGRPRSEARGLRLEGLRLEGLRLEV